MRVACLTLILLFIILLAACGPEPTPKNPTPEPRTDPWAGTWAWSNPGIASIHTATLITSGREAGVNRDTMVIEKTDTAYYAVRFSFSKEKLTGKETFFAKAENNRLLYPVGTVKLFLIGTDTMVFGTDTFHFVRPATDYTPSDKEGIKNLERVGNMQ